MADFLNETQESRRRITDTKTGADITIPVSGQSVAITNDGQHLRIENNDIAAWDGPVRPSSATDLAFCRQCEKGPFTTEAVFRCVCGFTSCKRCGKQHNGAWICQRCNRWRLFRAFINLFIG